MHDKESWQNIVPININTQTRSRAHFQAAQNTHDFMDNCTGNMDNSVAKLEFSMSVAVCIDPLNHQNATQRSPVKSPQSVAFSRKYVQQ